MLDGTNFYLNISKTLIKRLCSVIYFIPRVLDFVLAVSELSGKHTQFRW